MQICEIYDTIHLAKRIDDKLFGKEMPVKMRIALSGCPNACTSPMLNEIGIIGRVRPVRDSGSGPVAGRVWNTARKELLS